MCHEPGLVFEAIVALLQSDRAPHPVIEETHFVQDIEARPPAPMIARCQSVFAVSICSGAGQPSIRPKIGSRAKLVA